MSYFTPILSKTVDPAFMHDTLPRRPAINYSLEPWQHCNLKTEIETILREALRRTRLRLKNL